MPIGFETVTDPDVMRRVWPTVRSLERKVHLTEIPLVRDSSSGAAFDLNLTDILVNVKRRISDGTYRPRPPIVVESAKSRLLRRRLSFLSFEDSIILSTLVQAARPSLLEKSHKWVSFGRTDQEQKSSQDQQSIIIDYEEWWPKFLRQRKIVQLIEGDTNRFLVISDVTDFFGSIDLSLLRNKFESVNALDTRSTNLLFFLLEHLRPRDEYRPQGMLGLPVVQEDSSHILAHLYLSELDDELLPEGQDGRYTRWVDDMLVSVPSMMDAGMVMGRIERTLAKLGLVPNSSKTSLVTKAEFRKEHFEEHNEFLTRIHDDTQNSMSISKETRVEFEQGLRDFLTLQRVGQWNRILRRYYTESRRIRSRTLMDKWNEHLIDFPADSKYILDYVAFFFGSKQFTEDLFDYLREDGSLFEDIQILLYECLLLKPFPYDQELLQFIVEQTLAHFQAKDGFSQPSGYVKGLQSLVMYKFAPSRAAELIKPGFAEVTMEDPLFATYGLPVLAADEKYRLQAFEGIEEIEDSRILRVRALIERLEEGKTRTADVFMSLLKPKRTSLPTRFVLNARVLPLMQVAIRSRNVKSIRLIQQSMQQAYDKVGKQTDEDLVDYVALEHVKAALRGASAGDAETGTEGLSLGASAKEVCPMFVRIPIQERFGGQKVCYLEPPTARQVYFPHGRERPRGFW